LTVTVHLAEFEASTRIRTTNPLVADLLQTETVSACEAREGRQVIALFFGVFAILTQFFHFSVRIWQPAMKKQGGAGNRFINRHMKPAKGEPGLDLTPILSERVDQAKSHYRRCLLCEHRCAVDRTSGERGECKAGAEARVFRHRVEYGEELELVPSHLFYLSGCDLRCSFCIAEANAFDPRRGRTLTPAYFSEAVAWGRERHARNVQWVGGEPTIHLPAILEAMAGCDDLPPVVWKSDFHGTPEAFDLLSGLVQTYVADFKFGNNECARRICGTDNYVDVVGRNLKIAATHGNLIIRHLLLPGHFECCYRPVVEWVRRHLPNAKFSIRDGYLPKWKARHDADLAGTLEAKAGPQARDWATARGLHVVS
jgi:putative pyruvate formate lyase activating enzyme